MRQDVVVRQECLPGFLLGGIDAVALVRIDRGARVVFLPAVRERGISVREEVGHILCTVQLTWLGKCLAGQVQGLIVIGAAIALGDAGKCCFCFSNSHPVIALDGTAFAEFNQLDLDVSQRIILVQQLADCLFGQSQPAQVLAVGILDARRIIHAAGHIQCQQQVGILGRQRNSLAGVGHNRHVIFNSDVQRCRCSGLPVGHLDADIKRPGIFVPFDRCNRGGVIQRCLELNPVGPVTLAARIRRRQCHHHDAGLHPVGLGVAGQGIAGAIPRPFHLGPARCQPGRP